jgi:dephospho-CoA kinase
MKLLGLTGGIGSGKSTVADMFRDLGAVVVDADALARATLAPGTPGAAAVRDRFGAGLFDDAGVLDRKSLGALVFNDPGARAELEAIVHPQVAAGARARFDAARAQGVRLSLYDVPLLYEKKLERGMDAVVVVWAGPATRRRRLRHRDGLTDPEIDRRLAAQLPLEDKCRRADYVIDNDGSLEESQGQVKALFAGVLGITDTDPKAANPRR